jgi:hypothetical protein
MEDANSDTNKIFMAYGLTLMETRRLHGMLMMFAPLCAADADIPNWQLCTRQISVPGANLVTVRESKARNPCHLP